MRLLDKSWGKIVNNIEGLTNKRERTPDKCDRVATELKTFSTGDDILSTIRECHSALAAIADMKDVIAPKYRPPKFNEQAEDEVEKKQSFASTLMERAKAWVAGDKHFDLERGEKEAIRAIIECANEFRDNVGDMVSRKTPFLIKNEQDDDLKKVLALIRSGEEANLIIAHGMTERVQEGIKKDIIGKAQGAIGFLGGDFVRRAGLSKPEWLDYDYVIDKLEESREQKNNHGNS
jgi:hypothetical protein